MDEEYEKPEDLGAFKEYANFQQQLGVKLPPNQFPKIRLTQRYSQLKNHAKRLL